MVCTGSYAIFVEERRKRIEVTIRSQDGTEPAPVTVPLTRETDIQAVSVRMRQIGVPDGKRCDLAFASLVSQAKKIKSFEESLAKH